MGCLCKQEKIIALSVSGARQTLVHHFLKHQRQLKVLLPYVSPQHLILQIHCKALRGSPIFKIAFLVFSITLSAVLLL